MTFSGILQYGSDYTPAQFANSTTFANARNAPLDGSIIKIMTNAGQEFSTDVWGINLYRDSDLTQSRDYLLARRTIGWDRHKYNFAKLQIANVESRTIDWFNKDQTDKLIANMTVLAQFVTDAYMTGIWFDNEAYLPVWTYNSMVGKAAHTLAEYQARVYDIAYAIGIAWRGINPDMHVMVINAYDGYIGRLPDVAGSEWGLWKNFLDALHDAFGATLVSSNRSVSFVVSPSERRRGLNQALVSPSYSRGISGGKIILTTETMYLDTSPVHTLRYGVRQMQGTFDSYTAQGHPPSLTDLGSPPADTRYWGGSSFFPAVDQSGLGLWIDAAPFDPATPNANLWTPQAFSDALEVIMQNCEWAWIYNPEYSFFNGNSGAIPSAYLTKIDVLRAKYGLPA